MNCSISQCYCESLERSTSPKVDARKQETSCKVEELRNEMVEVQREYGRLLEELKSLDVGMDEKDDYGKCPVTGEELTMDDIVPVKIGKMQITMTSKDCRCCIWLADWMHNFFSKLLH
ncbi:hypothetical protein HRI_002239400 [Hibiscus trionum]|uniref:Uncharacterized protein n=1 Tax=Hibiscus trionum TaxID=183268 RepID=A0A9W7M2Z9_HIBTR|nr:hypothetical protein HRI_002239400 [Hibiscus trionum]